MNMDAHSLQFFVYNANKQTMIMSTSMSMSMSTYLLGLMLLSLAYLFKADDASTCSWTSKERDPALSEMTYDVGDGPQTFLAYVEPDVASFYQGNSPASTKVVPKFDGMAGKFINMSNQRVVLYWESSVGGPVSPQRHYTPFSSGGTATFPRHRFFFTLEGADTSQDNRLVEYVVKDYPENIYVYDPYLVEGDEAATKANLQKALNKKERELYEKWHKNLLFNEQYRNFTGRSYIANYLREPSQHFMWRADHFGQEHWVTTKETHFETTPPLADMDPIMMKPKDRVMKNSDPRVLQEHRVKDADVMNMTLRVLSCAPRVFEISNFLSPAEVQHILELAGGIELSDSTTGDIGGNANNQQIDPEKTRIQKTRTSQNSWVTRERSPVVDAIYRRSADLFRMDEALLRSRGKDEYPDMPTKKTLSESLQLVHYGLTQEYTAHHDFGYTDMEDKHNGARFLTLLFYLNDGMTGGETSFPRWVNAETFRRLSVTPEAGKAVLFYSQLPDGNMDDFSQHAAEPITDGEKWLINLWVWDPVKDV